ncbi:Na+/H+ antiporter [Corticibacter populi]|uniref:Na+/H+ antiporter n=1 Tax=Corticibacter populi TaxID=1550736 RepID=A0A3M6QM09_9BURK|nr:Na+/H+ antiporter [Corticibacter populi]RMX04074.1 Na+/H+ antiporter [Corticibacter populi]RZS33081.1 sodium/proton antiporter (CPA1 family) [Corticibacter populi]
MHTVEIVLLVLMFGAVSGLVSRYVTAIPLPLLQIALGAALAWPQTGLHIGFDPELFLLLFIPPLLFADGWRIPKREFFALYRPILMLALGLVLFTVVGLGYFVHWLVPSMPLPVAFALAAVLSPTDAVAVSAITRNLGMPEKTMRILEGESLLNDASGLVALKFAVAAVMTGAFSWTEAGKDFLWMAVGGVAVGGALGWVFGYVRMVVTRRLGDVVATQMVLLLLLLPFAAYILGERASVSGILAAVAAGMTTNFSDLTRSNFISERMQTVGAWMMVESAFNGAIFLLLGLQLPSMVREAMHLNIYNEWQLIGIVLAITAVALGLRWLWLAFGVHGSLLAVHHKGVMTEKPSWRLTLVSTLAGIRGAVTLAGALSIPLLLPSGHSFPARDLVVLLAAGVILATLLIASIGLPIVLRGLPQPKEPPSLREERHARVAACHAALQVLQAVDTEAGTASERALRVAAIGRVAQDYRNRLAILEEAGDPDVAKLSDRAKRGREQVLELQLRLKALQAERDEIYVLRRRHLINDDSLRNLVTELDLWEVSASQRLRASQANVQSLEDALEAARAASASSVSAPAPAVADGAEVPGPAGPADTADGIAAPDPEASVLQPGVEAPAAAGEAPAASRSDPPA